MVPKDDTGFSVNKAIYGSPLTIPGEFLGSLELPQSSYLSKIEKSNKVDLQFLSLIMFSSLRLFSSQLPFCLLGMCLSVKMHLFLL